MNYFYDTRDQLQKFVLRLNPSDPYQQQLNQQLNQKLKCLNSLIRKLDTNAEPHEYNASDLEVWFDLRKKCQDEIDRNGNAVVQAKFELERLQELNKEINALYKEKQLDLVLTPIPEETKEELE